MLSRTLKQPALSLCRHSATRNARIITRNESSNYKPTTPAPVEPAPVLPIQEHFINNTAHTVDYFRRFLKYSAVGLLAVSVTTWTAFEGAHMWVERVELASEKDEEVRKWEWDVEAEKWTGGESGGTDPGLRYFGRHTVRSAWMSQHWGTGSSGSVIGSNAYSGRGGSGAAGLNVVEARLEYAQAFLAAALQAAEKMAGSGKLRPQTATEILARHANIMERMGTREGLFEARSEYEKVWANSPGKGIEAARIALKLGDVNSRLGDREDALAWWSRAMHLVQLKSGPQPQNAAFTLPDTPPSEPLAQRTFISLLVSLSAFYATSGQLRQALAFEETSLDILRSIRQPESFESTSPPQALHALYILHRSALLSIHHAEVLYALRKKTVTSMEYLARAAESSERVALALTGLPSIHPDAPESKIPHPPSSEAALVPAYSKSVSMRRPAQSLLRDARRTAAEAWSLMGILTESSDAPGSKQRAFDCYERALGWAGVAADRAGGIGKPAEGTLEAEWKVLWNNYVRVRDAARLEQEKQEKKQKK
ncbi:hypothetical protein BDY19DRAFT_881337 [Irpex rosettiformis]|uniref:Uncharacterized protein n=1 Tax=Irpex rosettiformis TaxID=378272 RepID=A0ACB8UH99_9APHY|nr:hypothetical protein BDY19DRAFT_881337 [Irpex rosettiformis]